MAARRKETDEEVTINGLMTSKPRCPATTATSWDIGTENARRKRGSQFIAASVLTQSSFLSVIVGNVWLILLVQKLVWV